MYTEYTLMYSQPKTTRGKQFKATDLAYIAGFIDGEGTIGIYSNYAKDTVNPFYAERIMIVQVDPTPLLFIKNLFPNGGISKKNRPNPKHKTCYVLKYSHTKAYELVKAIYPYLQVKKERAAVLIEFRENIQLVDRTQPFFGGKRTTPEELKRREGLYQKLRDLNIEHGRPNVQPQRLNRKTSKEEVIVRAYEKS